MSTPLLNKRQLNKIKVNADFAVYHAKKFIENGTPPLSIMIDSIVDNKQRYGAIELINMLLRKDMHVPQKLYQGITTEPLAHNGVDWIWQTADELYRKGLPIPRVIVDALAKYKDKIWWVKHTDKFHEQRKILNDILVRGLSWRYKIAEDDIEALSNL